MKERYARFGGNKDQLFEWCRSCILSAVPLSCRYFRGHKCMKNQRRKGREREGEERKRKREKREKKGENDVKRYRNMGGAHQIVHLDPFCQQKITLHLWACACVRCVALRMRMRMRCVCVAYALRMRCVCVAYALRMRCVCVAFALRTCDLGGLVLEHDAHLPREVSVLQRQFTVVVR